MISADSITKPVAAMTAVITMLGGSYTLVDKFGWLKKDILKWDAEHFSITDGPASGEFEVVVARQKIRDDCSVEEFTLEVKDSKYLVHRATSSIAKFSGPASPTVDKFGYTIKIEDPDKVALGTARLLARILYKCPEGNVIITYPDHKNLNFSIGSK